MRTDKYLRLLVFAVFLLPTICQPQNASDDPLEQYTDEFFASVGEIAFSQMTNAPAWCPPKHIPWMGNTWTVLSKVDAEEPFDNTFSLVSTDETEERLFHVASVSEGTMVRPILAAAINIPCNMPPTLLASSFSVSSPTSGLFFLQGPRPAHQGTYLFSVCRNLILVIPDAGNDAKQLAIALLRAGGVDIPEVTQPEPSATP